VHAPHCACCRSRADACSAAVHFASRQAAAALRKAVLVHTQVKSVLEKEERVREGCPEAVEREEHVQGSASAGRQGTLYAAKDAILGKHADDGRHDEGSENAERTNKHRSCVGREEK
jgi:hypothetical protein